MVIPSSSRINNTDWKILIIDDDEDDFLIARDMLKEARGRKFNLHWAKNYSAGRKELTSENYNAVLVDYDLGQHSGIELIREATERGYAAPFILFTGRGNYEVDVEAMEAGATLYLSKGEATPLLLERAIRYAIELKQKEQSLRESEAALRLSEAKERAKVAEMNAILDAVPAIVWITHDTQAKEVTGNQAGHDFLRIPAGKNLSKTAPTDAPRNFQVYQEGRELAPEELPLQITAATGQPIRNFEEEVVFEDGDRAHLLGNVTPLLDDEGNPFGAVGAFINITKRKQAEQALKKAEERFAKAFHSSPAALAITRSSDGRYIEANESLCKVTGYDRDEIIGHTALELGIYANPDQRAELLGLLKQHGTVRNYELEVRAKTGILRTMLGSYDFIELDHETCLLATLIDITDRKRVEVALRESEATLRESQDTLRQAHQKATWMARFPDENPNPVLRVSGDGIILYCNKASASLLGQDCKVGQHLTGPVMRLVEQAMIQGNELREDTPVSGQYYSFSITPIREENYVNIYGTDITDRKQAEQKLQFALDQAEQGRRLLDALLENIPEGISITGGPPHFQIEYVSRYGLEITQNPTGSALLGRRAGEHQDAWGIFLADGETRPSREQMPLYRASHFGETVRHQEMVMRLQNGERIHVLVNAAPIRDDKGQITGAINSWQDITDRKLTELALKRSIEQERARAAEMEVLMDTVPALIWIARDPLCREMSGNRYGVEFLKMWQGANISKTASEENLNQQPYRNFKDGREIPTEELPMQVAAATGQPATNYDFDLVFKDGTVRTVLGNVNPLFDEQGKPSGAVAAFMDITDRRQVEEQLQHYARELERSNQSLQDFAFIASHDLQEPLRKIILFGNHLRKHLSDSPDKTAEDYLARMQNAAGRMQAMINGLLDLSRVNTHGADFAPVSLKRVADEVVLDLEARMESAGGSITVEQLPTIEADELQMRQLFQNLIGNAIKFHKPDVPPMVRVSGKIMQSQKATHIEIVVEDNGIGFEQQYAERIFQPFQRLHGRTEYEGTGLGLAICQKIVERHHGSIAVQSAPGEGTTFTVRLPAKPPAA